MSYGDTIYDTICDYVSDGAKAEELTKKIINITVNEISETLQE